MKKLVVGQVLWFVLTHSRHSQPKDVTVLKVGRNWAQIDNGMRICVETLVADGGPYSPPGCCYLSKEVYEAEVALDKAWRELAKTIQYKSVPDGVTVTDIAAARNLLRLPSNAEVNGERSGPG